MASARNRSLISKQLKENTRFPLEREIAYACREKNKI